MSTDTPDTDRNVTAFFDTREAAEQAIARVVEAGLPRDKILLRAGAARRAAFVDDGKGLLQEVKELILPSEEPDAAVAALKHEGFLLSVRPEPEAHDTVCKLLDQAGGKGIESREDIWPDWKSRQDASREDEYPEGATSEAAGASGAPEDPAEPSEPAAPPGSAETAPQAAEREPAASDDPARST